MKTSYNKQVALSYLYSTVKEGDSIAFYNKGLKGFFIKLFTGGEIMHVAKVYDVFFNSRESKVYFKVSDLIQKGGRLYQACVGKKHGKCYISKDFAGKPILLSIKKPLNDRQIKIGKDDCIEQIGKKYGTFTLWRYISWINYLIPSRLKKTINSNITEQQRVCSLHCLVNDYKTGLLSENEKDKILKQDIGLSPTEYSKMDYLKGV